MNFVPLNNKTHFSLLDALSKPDQIATRVAELGYDACGVMDHGNISAAIQFMQALKDTCNCTHSKSIHLNGKECVKCDCKAFDKKKIKPIIGCEFYVEQESFHKGSLCVIAKNQEGWKSLIGAISYSNKEGCYNVQLKQPTINLHQLTQIGNKNFIVLTGHPGTFLANSIFGDNYKLAYGKRTYDEAKSLVRSDWKESTNLELAYLYDLFGRDNVFIEIFRVDKDNFPASDIIAKILRSLDCKKTAAINSHYCRSEEASDHRILLCCEKETTLSVLRNQDLQEEKEEGSFLRSSNYYIPSLDEIKKLHTEEEIANTELISSMCEEFNVFSTPRIPKFDVPDSVQYLRQICRDGWKRRIAQLPKEKHSEYEQRIKYELKVIEDAKLMDYFLIVQDFVNHARGIGCLIGPARGSGGGCLTSYLIGITAVDPVEHKLLFERFYNSGRNTKDHISLPDIDVDFPKYRREEVIAYIKQKYGEACVSQMITFGCIKGRSAIKDVLRSHEACTFEEMNKITKFIPDEAKIADDLQEMKEEEGEASIIRWAIENNAKELSEWVKVENGVIIGPMSKLFEQAIRLENTKRQSGRHASGIVITPEPLADLCPMVYNKGGKDPIAGWDMRDLEKVGIAKFDILGVAVLDKIGDILNG